MGKAATSVPDEHLFGGMTDKPYEVKKHVSGFKFWRLTELAAGKPPKFSGHFIFILRHAQDERIKTTKAAHVFWPRRLVGQAWPNSPWQPSSSRTKGSRNGQYDKFEVNYEKTNRHIRRFF